MDALTKIDTDLIQNALNKESEKMQTCQYCGKPYVWFKRELFNGTKILKIQVPDCKCQELREKEQERQKFLQYKSEKLARLFDNSMMSPFFKEKTFENLSQTIELEKCKEYAKLFNPADSLGIQ